MSDAAVIVVGGGLAGLTCALDLAERGIDVSLLEGRAHLGGRTASWIEDGMPVESGLHRFLGYYKALPALLRRVGVDLDAILCWEDEFEVRLPDGRSGIFGMSPFHKPLQTARGVVANNDILSPLDKAALGAFFAAGLMDYFVRPGWLDGVTVFDYARKHRVRESAIRNILVPLTAGIFFIPPERYSAYGFFGLLAPALPRPHRIRLGAFTGGMTETMALPIARAIEAAGGTVVTGAPVEALDVRGGEVLGVHVGPERFRAEHVVLATALEPAQRLIRGARDLAGHGWFQPMLTLPSMPAVTFQLELDEPATDADRTTFAPGTILASFAEQSRTTFKGQPGRLSAILTPPEELLDLDAAELFSAVCRDAHSIGIDIERHTRRYRKIAWPADFYSLSPGTDRLRPSQRTPIPGLTLAGDYTRQRLLATMEGAVLSGHAAATAAERAIGPRR